MQTMYPPPPPTTHIPEEKTTYDEHSLLQTLGKVVHTGTGAEEEEDFLLAVTLQKMHQLAQFLICIHNLQQSELHASDTGYPGNI